MSTREYLSARGIEPDDTVEGLVCEKDGVFYLQNLELSHGWQGPTAVDGELVLLSAVDYDGLKSRACDGL